MSVERATRRQSEVLVPPELPLGGLRRGGALKTLSGVTMGTTWRVAFVDRATRDCGGIVDVLQQRLGGIVEQMSTWLPTSHISAFNAAAAGTSHDLPADFQTVMSCALDVAHRSAGAFDPTVGSLVALWGFGAAKGPPSIPAPEAIVEMRRRVGYRLIQCDPECSRLNQPGGMALDLSSIAKGFGVDAIARCLEAMEIDSYLCEIGGELRGSGCKPDGSPWWVKLETPSGCPVENTDTILALCGKSVATSGNYVQYFSADGRQFGHTLDPRTGYPITHDVLSVSVIADDCMTADALATAILVLGPNEGLAWADANNVSARLCHRDGQIKLSRALQLFV
jgi:thiamine biosynthesis lipoprotein